MLPGIGGFAAYVSGNERLLSQLFRAGADPSLDCGHFNEDWYDAEFLALSLEVSELIFARSHARPLTLGCI